MEKKIGSFLIFLSCCGFWNTLNGQETIPATGGNATGSGGSVSYTIGQITFQTLAGTTGTVAQGVQQPFEISDDVTAIDNTTNINIGCTVYPNPTRGSLRLVVESSDYENLRFRLFNINGVLLKDYKVEARETEISLDDLSSSVYFLKVMNSNKELKVFKIIKR
jgi:hypothetical protein